MCGEMPLGSRPWNPRSGPRHCPSASQGAHFCCPQGCGLEPAAWTLQGMPAGVRPAQVQLAKPRDRHQTRPPLAPRARPGPRLNEGVWLSGGQRLLGAGFWQPGDRTLGQSWGGPWRRRKPRGSGAVRGPGEGLLVPHLSSAPLGLGSLDNWLPPGCSRRETGTLRSARCARPRRAPSAGRSAMASAGLCSCPLLPLTFLPPQCRGCGCPPGCLAVIALLF